MSWTGGHPRSSGLPNYPQAWGLPTPGPPSSGHRSASKHEQDKQAAAKKRKEEAAAARAERARRDGVVANENLFSAPRRTDASQAAEVEAVMGQYNSANTTLLNTQGYIGVDYAPPTPAPMRDHIIGEEDEDDSLHHKPFNVRKHPVTFSSQARQHHMLGPPTNLPPKKPHPPPKVSSWSSGSSMAPPQSPSVPVKPYNKHTQPLSTASNNTSSSTKKIVSQQKQKLSPLKMPSNERKAIVTAQISIEGDAVGLPPPLSGIETPRVEVEDRGAQRHKPVYGFFPKMSNSPPSKKSCEPISTNASEISSTVPSGNNHSSSSGSDSDSEDDKSDKASGSDSEESDVKDEQNKIFSLGDLLKPSRLSPGLSSSERSVNVSERSVKQSPPYGFQPTPSPAAPSPSQGNKNESKLGGFSVSLMDVPIMMSPLPDDPLPSPKHMTKASSDSDQELVQSSSKEKLKRDHPKHSNSSVQLSSDEEQNLIELEKPRKTSKLKFRPKGVKLGSERKENKCRNKSEDSDSDTGSFDNHTKSEKWKLQQRSHSSSPIKKHIRNPGSSHSTPRHRPPSSTHSTPVREKKTGKESPRKDAKKTPQSSKKKFNQPLSDRSVSEDTEEEVLSPNKSPRTEVPPLASQKKKSALASVFGKIGGGGGKGKGKDKGRGGKGGIKVFDREDSDHIDDEPVTHNIKASPNMNRFESNSPKISGETDKSSKHWANLENNQSLANIKKNDGLRDDLTLSEDDSISSPGISCNIAPCFKSETDREINNIRPRLLISLPLSKLGRALNKLQNKFKHQKGKKSAVKQECWITSGDEKSSGSSSSNRKRKLSDSPGVENCETIDKHRISDNTSSPFHRKDEDRTYFGENSDSYLELTKRSPGYDSDQVSSKRLRISPSMPDTHSIESNHVNYFGPDPEPPPPDPSLLPSGPAHPTWPGSGAGNLMLPPPYPPKRVYYSYFERKHQDEAFDDEEENVVDEAKRLKHEADHEANINTKCRKYLQAIIMFSVCGSRTELMGDKSNASNMYIQTINIIKFVMKLTNSSRNNNQDVDTRLVVLSLRAQSLLNLKLYKMSRHQLKDSQKTILDVLAKTEDDHSDQNRTDPMSTPSPAGSEESNCSKSSDYYSSGENRQHGVLTPPTVPPICLSIPRNVMQSQYTFCSYLSQCHELWEQADLYVVKGVCEDFFIRLDQECGPLTLHSSLKDLVNYTRKGLESIEQDRQTTADLLCGIPSSADSFR